MRLDYHRPLQTKDGRDVQIITFEGRDPEYPLVGYVTDDMGLYHWSATGRCFAGLPELNLINKPGIQHIRYLNFYANGAHGLHVGLNTAKSLAESAGKNNPCIARIRVTIVEGQFDE